MKSQKFKLAIVALLLPLFFASAKALPPDECLKMIVEDGKIDSTQHPTTGEWEYSENVNPDSVLIDTCKNSSTYQRIYAKKYWDILFKQGEFPFSTTLGKNDIATIDDFDSATPELINYMEALENEYGKIYFTGLDRDTLPNTHIYQDALRLYFENYQDLFALSQYYHIENPTQLIERFSYLLRYTEMLTNVEDEILKIGKIFPNPANTIINIDFETILYKGKIAILNSAGELIKELEYANQIDISDLPTGVYFVTHGNQIGKFIKE